MAYSIVEAAPLDASSKNVSVVPNQPNDEFARNEFSRFSRLWPQVPAQVQLGGAAVVWLVGSIMVLRYGVIFMSLIGWPLWLLAPAVILGFLKSQFIMLKTSKRTVRRIHAHGRSWFFNLYSGKTWLLIVGMIGLGLLLRLLGPTELIGYRYFLAGLYVAVGLGLLLSDRIFWIEFIKSLKAKGARA